MEIFFDEAMKSVVGMERALFYTRKIKEEGGRLPQGKEPETSNALRMTTRPLKSAARSQWPEGIKDNKPEGGRGFP